MSEFDPAIIRLLTIAMQEDIGSGDITTEAIIPEKLLLQGSIFAKEDGRIAGLSILQLFFSHFYNSISVNSFSTDGERIQKGHKIVEIRGPGRILLTTERLILNILQRMSGIATQTAHFVERVRGTNATILDTRKTAPGLRALDKLAVQMGGGTNHRLGLFDSYLVKENHIEAAGSLTEAVRRIREKNSQVRTIEVEVRSLSELKEALGLHLDRILLDNMSIEQMKSAVELAGGRTPLEASGNITLENVRQVADTGVNFISVGSLTHSVRALDLSFMIEKS